jgi:hypothetical protein
MDDELRTRFMRLFKGLDRAYGRYQRDPNTDEPSNPKKGGKGETHRDPITTDHYDRHLEGTEMLGVIPIQDGNVVEFAAIDIDDYTLNIPELIEKVKDCGLPLVPCRSKSGGLHLYVFNKVPLDAKLVQTKLHEIASNLGYPRAEVFPKQTKLAPDGVGNWINLPYFDVKDTDRFAYDVESGREIKGFPLFLRYAEGRRVDRGAYRQIRAREVRPEEAGAALADGPPCLQSLLANGIEEGGRNTVLFNLAIYSKAKHKGDGEAVNDAVLAEMIELQRAHFRVPLDDDEMEGVIRNVLQSRDTLRYQCTQAPLVGLCNRPLCNQRKYGIGLTGTAYSYGQLWHVVPQLEDGTYIYDDSTYRLQVTLGGDDHYLELNSKTLLKHGEVATQALNRGVLLPPMDNNDWRDIMARKMLEVELEIVPEEYSSVGVLRRAVIDMFDNFGRASEKRMLRSGQAWYNDKDAEYWVLPELLADTLKEIKTARPMTKNEQAKLLREVFGAERTRRRVTKGSEPEPVYIFPEAKLPELRIRRDMKDHPEDDD